MHRQKTDTRPVNVHWASMLYQSILGAAIIMPTLMRVIEYSKSAKGSIEPIDSDETSKCIAIIGGIALMMMGTIAFSTFLVKRSCIQHKLTSVPEDDDSCGYRMRKKLEKILSPYAISHLGVAAGLLAFAETVNLLATKKPDMSLGAGLTLAAVAGIALSLVSILPSVTMTNSFYNKKFNMFGSRYPAVRQDEESALNPSSSSSTSYGATRNEKRD